MLGHNSQEDLILVRNGFIFINPDISKDTSVSFESISFRTSKTKRNVATILMNMAYYGYTLSARSIMELSSLSNSSQLTFWEQLEDSLKFLTGDHHNIGDYIVYKNFPKEVLNMSTSEYWLRQIFIYLGCSYNVVREKEEKREETLKELDLKVLHSCDENTLGSIFSNLVSLNNRWSFNQSEDALFLQNILSEDLDLSCFGFKENGISLMVSSHLNKNCSINSFFGDYESSNKIIPFLESGLYKESPDRENKGKFIIEDATDVLRFASGISGNNISLRGNINFGSFSRKDRRFLLSFLENSKNLESDIAMRKSLFKKLFARLHPGDYNFSRVSHAYDLLFNKETEKTFNSIIEEKYSNCDESLIEMLKTRPGTFIRNFHRMYSLYGDLATKGIISIIDEFNTNQLLKFKGYLSSVNQRYLYAYPPNGDWSKAQFKNGYKSKIEDAHLIIQAIDGVIKNRLNQHFGDGFSVDDKLKQVKLQTNDQKLAEYGRGTIFDIPDNIEFIRTASFWNDESDCFLDNTWNFFDNNWNSLGGCCWDVGFDDAAVFSGDAINTSTNGKASQLIDIYFNKLREKGVRYCVWSILSYSRVPFNNFKDAYAGLQFGVDAQKGKHFDPSRTQLSFEINKENDLSKIVAYLDLEKNQLIYVDINRQLCVDSGNQNKDIIGQEMPYIIAYMDSLPSVHDLLSTTKGDIPALYSDKNVIFDKNLQRAYIFKRENEMTDVHLLSVNEIVNS